MSAVSAKNANSRFVLFFTLLFCVLAGSSGFAHANSDADIEALRAQLEEAKAMLAQDSASHRETLEKKRKIDALLEARKAREVEIKEEVRQLCEAHDQLNAGSFADCMQRLGA